MQKKKVSQTMQALQGLFITDADWACARIAACHHQGLGCSLFGQKQVVQGRVGKH